MRNRRSFRLFTHLCRVVVAITFIFSGAVKSMDPWGTALSVNNYLVTYGLEGLKPLVMIFSIWLCGAELMMGCMLIFKVRIRMCSTFATASMIFFTILTLLSATVMPVEDCGCFGDVIKLTPWESFFKNLVLLPLIMVVWWRYRPDRMFAFSRLEASLAALFLTFSMGVGTYSYLHLPPVDLLPYKEGTNIAQAMDEARNRQMQSDVVLIYRNIRTGKLREFSLDDNAWQNDSRWEWVDTRVAEDVADRVEPMILEFYISDEQGEVTDSLLSIKGNLYMLCVTNRAHISDSCEKRLRSVVEQAAAEEAPVICLTPEPITRPTYHSFADSEQVRCYNIDSKTMKTMLRANTGLVVLTDGIITRKANCRDI
ncbi:MAG: DoxX protein [Alistipes sp.]|nr:DoxX protein [Alistipes sp.]